MLEINIRLMIGEKTAEDLKINIGSAFKGSRNLTYYNERKKFNYRITR